MPVLTPFGVEVRKHRLDRQMLLLDLARAIGKSSAFVSAIETGRKPIPPGYVESIVEAMDLTREQANALQTAADVTRREVRLDRVPSSQRDLVAAFARKVDDLPPDLIALLRKHVMKSLSSDTPFRRRRGMLVPPMSTKKLWAFAERVRSAFVTDNQVELPIIKILELGMPKFFDGFYVESVERAVMGDEEGRVIGGENGIMLRQDVYDAACNGNGRARFTCCHELAHFLLHREVTMARISEPHHKIFYDSEWQADTFAGTILVSTRHLGQFSGPDDVAEACGVTFHAAEVMWSKYQKEGKIAGPNVVGFR